jgi:hypothetical protein
MGIRVAFIHSFTGLNHHYLPFSLFHLTNGVDYDVWRRLDCSTDNLFSEGFIAGASQ